MAVAVPRQLHNPNLPEQPLRRRMSFEEFLEWDGDGNPELHAEWVDGEAVPMVSINARHSFISVFLITLLGVACRAKRIGTILFDPFVMRPAANANGRSPDVMVVRSEHIDRIESKYLNGPADIVVEIVSPGSIKTDYFIKQAEYARAGVPEYWIIDPAERVTTFLLLSEQRQYTEAHLDDAGCFSSPGLNGLLINPVWFNQDPLPDELDILREWGIIPAA